MNEKDKLMKKVTVFFDDKESKILESLINEYGGKAPAVIKEAIKYRYDKAFPPHNRGSLGTPKSPLTPPTPSQICESLGGTVKEGPNGGICVGAIGYDGFPTNVPMTMMGFKGEAGDWKFKG